jgi:acylphosphatase
MSDFVRLTAIVRGTVQGVGFRYTTNRTAVKYPVAGTVRNLPDGTVEIVAEGLRKDVQAFLNGVKTSRVGGYISEVEERWSRGTKAHNSFDISY